MRKDLLRVALVFAAFSIARAQDPAPAPSASPARPKFEVVSIRECVGKVQPPSPISSPGKLRLGCWPLWRLISDAYDTFADGKVDLLKPPMPIPLEGAPNWTSSALYTIDAQADGPQSPAMMRGPMMQALLEDRFHVGVHRETREIFRLCHDRGQRRPNTETHGGRQLRSHRSDGSRSISARQAM